MRVIQDCPEAQWLPSRSHFAIFRLASYIRLRTASPSKDIRMALAVDRDQNAFENLSISAMIFVVTVAYLVPLLEQRMPWWAAVAVAIAIAPVADHIPFFFTGLLAIPLWRRITGRSGDNNMAANSAGEMTALLATSLWFVSGPEPIRIVAAAVLALFALNTVAAVLMWLLRARVRELEARCGA
jgi:hypothetical protein